MDKLELKHIYPYLPYGLNVLRPDGRTILELYGIESDLMVFHEIGSPNKTYGDLVKNKPILRPLSDYKDVVSQDMSDLNCDLSTQIEISEFANRNKSLSSLSYAAYTELLQAKVDVFSLIPLGLAIDINTLKEGVNS